MEVVGTGQADRLPSRLILSDRLPNFKPATRLRIRHQARIPIVVLPLLQACSAERLGRVKAILLSDYEICTNRSLTGIRL